MIPASRNNKVYAIIRRGSLDRGRQMTVGFSKTEISDLSFEESDSKPTLLYSNPQNLVGFLLILKWQMRDQERFSKRDSRCF